MITTSLPLRRMSAALRTCSVVSDGQSVPMTRHGPAAATAASMRAPRSPSTWHASAMPCCAPSAWKAGWDSSGAAHSVTGPTAAAQAVATARAVNRACSTAARSPPSSGISRVLAKPATGALASTATATRSLIAVLPRELFGICAEEVGKAQPPHQHHGGPYTVFLPASPGGDGVFGDAQWPAHALEPLAERNVLHQRNLGKAAGGLERIAP